MAINVVSEFKNYFGLDKDSLLKSASARGLRVTLVTCHTHLNITCMVPSSGFLVNFPIFSKNNKLRDYNAVITPGTQVSNYRAILP